MLTNILIFSLLGSTIQITKGEENASTAFNYEWTVEDGRQDLQFFNLELNKTAIRASIISYLGSSLGALFFKSIDPRDANISCATWVPSRNVAFDKDYWRMANLENGKIVAMSSALNKVFIVEMANCDRVTIENQNGEIEPYDNSFDLVRFEEGCSDGDVCLTRFDDQGMPMYRQINIKVDSNYKPLAAFNFKSNSSYSKYVVIRYKYSRCGFLWLGTCYTTVVDILSSKLRAIASFTHHFSMKTYSRAHNYLSLCGNGDEGIECGILDLKRGSTKDVSLNKYWVYQNYASVHSMKDGGMVLIFCSTSGVSSGCEMMFYVADGYGKDLIGPTPVDGENVHRTVYADRDPDPYFKPVVVEKDADDRVYCFIIPGVRVTEGKCLKISSQV